MWPSRSASTTSRASPAMRFRQATAGICVALADKLETLAGLFGIGEKPTGERDPYALRRHALGVLRMLKEQALPLESGRAGRRSARRLPGRRAEGQRCPRAG